MISSLKPYPAYKDSGLPWLGQVPGHWSIRRLKSAATNVNAQTTEMLKDDVYIALEHVESWTGHARPQEDSQLFTGQVKRFRRGDVLFGKLRPYLAKVTRARTDGVCAGEFFVLRPIAEDLSPPYLEHALRAKNTIDVINGSTFGARMPRADWQFVGNLPIPLPPPSEQAAIVRFLDWANGRLERAIRAKRKIITLLNEQKQAIIHQAVTRGLDPSVRLKPSGIPWLGEIPEHWEVRKLRTLFHLQGSGTTPSGEQFYGGSTNWVMSGDLNDSVVCRTKRQVQEVALETYPTLKLYPPGSLIVAMYGATIGKTGILGEPACTNQACCVLALPVGKTKVRFLQLVVQTAKPHLVSESYGGGQPNINAEVVRSLRIGLPPAKEQELILGSVDDSTVQLDNTISRLEREIILLREYRTRLVADVVTGKLDVREAAERLPDEEPIGGMEGDVDIEDESEALDEEALT